MSKRLLLFVALLFAGTVLPPCAWPSPLASIVRARGGANPVVGQVHSQPTDPGQKTRVPSPGTAKPQTTSGARNNTPGSPSTLTPQGTSSDGQAPATGEAGEPAATGANSESAKEDQQQAASTEAPAPGLVASHLGVLAGVALVGVALSLGLAGFVFYRFRHFEKQERFNQETRKAAPTKDLAVLSKRLQVLEDAAPTTSTQRDRPPDELIRNLDQRVSALEQELNRLQAFVQEGREYAVESLSRSVDQLRGEFKGIAEAVAQDGSRYTSDRAAVADARSADGAGEALASVVNAWLAMRSGDRSQLLSLAEQAGLREPRPGALDGGPASSASNFEITLNLGGDGPWIAVPVPGSRDFWAAPADAQFMTMGAAPMLLSQLFEGMGGAQQGFRFAAIYRCCRLRPVAGRANAYTLQERGLLQLEGASAPAERRPADLSAFVSAGVQRASAERGRPVGQVLGDWIKMIACQLNEHTRDLAALQEDLTGPSTAMQPANVTEIHRLSRELSDLRREHEQLAAEFRRRFEQMREPAGARPTEPMGSRGAGANAGPRAPAFVAEGSRPPAQLPPQTLDPVRETPTQVEPVPPDQREALLWAAKQSEGDAGTDDVPSQELYIRRLQALEQALADHSPKKTAAIFHVVKRPGVGTLELHDTEPGGEGTIQCRVCHDRESWQLVVVAGDPSTELQLFLPVGTLAKSNYAPGYSALIEDVPSGSFRVTAEQRPALLGGADRPGNYTVLRKLILNATPPPFSGRA